jgi:hypothetical protein
MIENQDLTLYDLMGEDMSIFCKLIDTKHVHVEINDERDVTVYAETSHIYAWESLVSFARSVLSYDKKIQEEVALLEAEEEYYKGFKK